MEEQQPQTENSPSSSNDSGQEFVGLRPYIQNETQRRIDWKTMLVPRIFMVKDFLRNTVRLITTLVERVPSEDTERRLTILQHLDSLCPPTGSILLTRNAWH